MYNSVFSMLIAAKAAEIKSNPTRTEILSEEQWLRKLIDGKKPVEFGRNWYMGMGMRSGILCETVMVNKNIQDIPELL